MDEAERQLCKLQLIEPGEEYAAKVAATVESSRRPPTTDPPTALNTSPVADPTLTPPATGAHKKHALETSRRSTSPSKHAAQTHNQNVEPQTPIERAEAQSQDASITGNAATTPLDLDPKQKSATTPEQPVTSTAKSRLPTFHAWIQHTQARA